VKGLLDKVLKGVQIIYFLSNFSLKNYIFQAHLFRDNTLIRHEVSSRWLHPQSCSRVYFGIAKIHFYISPFIYLRYLDRNYDGS
jgi:hypothetical protein